MADLYKGIAGSPITYLTSDITANQTTISIDDDSALPDAPNICTIGYGEQLETIKYETKSNGVLQNVTRGIEGTPRAWQAGTEVARFFTAYDHNAIIDDFVAHKAESVSQIKGVARDLTLAGVQSINTQKRPKSIKITANVWNTKKISIGYYSANVQYALGHVANTSTYAWINGSTVYILENTNDITRGIIQNVTDTGFEIKWEKVGAGATGNVRLFIICQYHGE